MFRGSDGSGKVPGKSGGSVFLSLLIGLKRHLRQNVIPVFFVQFCRGIPVTGALNISCSLS